MLADHLQTTLFNFHSYPLIFLLYFFVKIDKLEGVKEFGTDRVPSWSRLPAPSTVFNNSPRSQLIQKIASRQATFQQVPRCWGTNSKCFLETTPAVRLDSFSYHSAKCEWKNCNLNYGELICLCVCMSRLRTTGRIYTKFDINVRTFFTLAH